MHFTALMKFFRFVSLLFFALVVGAECAAAADFPRGLETYQDSAVTDLGAKILGRARDEPFNVFATVMFVCAIFHTFLTSKIRALSHRYQRRVESLAQPAPDRPGFALRDRLQFRAQMLHFAGEVEAVFGIWLVPLFLAIVVLKGWGSMVHYVSETSFAEPVFVAVIMAIAASRPVLAFAESVLGKVAALGRGTPAAWWLAILTIGPLLGSFITEPAAMTICALVLSRRFYALNPSPRLRYGTLGLLFVNISVGGTLTHFAAPPVVMVARKWGWDARHMFLSFGWKAALGIAIATAVYFVFFQKELRSLSATGEASESTEPRPPFRLVCAHLLFLVWTVFTAHYSALVVLGFLFFLAFVKATDRHQDAINLRAPLLVGFFLAALVVHGGLQSWWIAPVLGSLGEWPLMIGGTLLTAVNDNAAITYLATLVPGFTDPLKYAVVAGAMVGGGLTVIANAPNPAGQSILQSHFGEDGIAPLKLFVAALVPTLIMGAAFMLLR